MIRKNLEAKDFILELVPTPSNEGDGQNGQDEENKEEMKKSSVSSLAALDLSWISEHARQVNIKSASHSTGLSNVAWRDRSDWNLLLRPFR